MKELLLTFAISLGLTLLLELLIARLCRLRGRDYLLVLLVNILTNPAVVYLDMVCASHVPNGRDLWQIPLEVAAILIEGWCYARYARSLRRPWTFALVANVFSYGFGLFLNTLP
jgi:hypothetical protein